MYRHVFPKGGIGVEVGVLQGENACVLIQETMPQKLHLVDRWDHGRQTEELVERYHGFYLQAIEMVSPYPVEIHKGYSHERASDFPDDYFDWVYIDARIHYESMLEDLWSYYRKVKPGGVLAGRGFLRPGIRQAVNEILNEGICELICYTTEDNHDYSMRVREKIEVS